VEVKEVPQESIYRVTRRVRFMHFLPMWRSSVSKLQAVLHAAARRELRLAGLLAAAVLYGCTSALASEDAVTAPAPPPPALDAPVPLGPGPDPRIGRPVPPRPDSPERPPLSAAEKTPHVALLLPLGSQAFRRHAEAVRDGFQAAARVQGGAGLPVRVYALGDDPQQAVEHYIRALEAGARVAVGPLTRSAVSAIADSATALVPTLLLNVPERRPGAPGDNLYVFSLQIEAEARQVAQIAYHEGYRKAIVVADDSPLLRRVRQAFVDRFTGLGGAEIAAHTFTPDPSGLARIKQAVDAGAADVAFLALDFRRARLARPYLGALPIFATSLVHAGDAGTLAGFDLAGVRFLDMPWLLQPDHPAVMSYARRGFQVDIELNRFYAFGIDAFRIALTLLGGTAGAEIDGVTGRLTLGPDRRFVRGLTAAQFTDGKVTAMRPRP